MTRYVVQKHRPDSLWGTESSAAENARTLSDRASIMRFDIDGDGREEILFSLWDGIYDVERLTLFAILQRRVDGTWGDWYHEEIRRGWYCGAARMRPSRGSVTVDYFSCAGGTGISQQYWDRRLLRCYAQACRKVWSANLYTMESVAEPDEFVTIAVEWSEITRQTPDSIEVTTYRTGTVDVPTERLPWAGFPLERLLDTRRITGPNTVSTYAWNGSAYTLVSVRQVLAGTRTVEESDAQTVETTRLAHALVPDSGGDREFVEWLWGGELRGGLPWLWTYTPDAAAHTGSPDQLGEWVAAVIGAKDRLACALTVQHHVKGVFQPLNRIDLPCVPRFTHLAWVDVTGDGQPELLVRTLLPSFSNNVDRLFVYSIGERLTEIGSIFGNTISSDRDGVYWKDIDGDGRAEILAGQSLDIMWGRFIDLPLEPARRYQVYRWNAQTRQFVAGEIITPAP